VDRNQVGTDEVRVRRRSHLQLLLTETPETTMTIAAPAAATTSAPAGAVRRATEGWVRDAVLLAFRLVICFLFLLHAVMAFGALGGIDGAGTPVPAFTLGWWAGVIETVGAVLIAVGLYTRAAAFVLSGVMAFAYFSVHAPLGWNPIYNMGEPAALYSWIFLLICVVGGGRYAVDTLRARR
jgi:putative oxidoreductase